MKLKIALLAASMLAGFSLSGANAQSVNSICVKNAAGNCTQVSPTAAFPVNVVAGGTGGGAVFGPTANGSPAANPPILMGGTADGTATGTVQNQKVDSSGNGYVSASIPNGANVALGSTTDAAVINPATAATLIAKIGGVLTAVQSAIPAGTAVIGYTTNDPCGQATKLGAPISLTASGQIIAGTSAKKTYICSIDLVSATTQNVALVEGTGSVCATNIYGLAGGTTAATGWNLAANGGLTKGSGLGTVYIGSADANGTAANICLLSSSSGQISGEMTYVQQ